MQSQAKTVAQYLAELPEERRAAIAAVREVILKHLPKGIEEGMGYGMISYHVPHSVYPAGYHVDPSRPLPFAALAAQKNHLALYLMHVYGDAALEGWFREAWRKSGKKLDMGKSCVRFKRREDVPLEVIGQVIEKVPVKELIERYQATIAAPRRSRKQRAASAQRSSGKRRG